MAKAPGTAEHSRSLTSGSQGPGIAGPSLSGGRPPPTLQAPSLRESEFLGQPVPKFYRKYCVKFRTNPSIWTSLISLYLGGFRMAKIND